MTRVCQPAGSRGSLKWIQRAIEEDWRSLDEPIQSHLRHVNTINWLSPVRADDFAEYRDGEFLDLVGLSHLRASLADFWPARGPQWDALGVTDQGDVLLVEAKAHVGELCSPGTAASGNSLELIEKRLGQLAEKLGARPERADWTRHFYQLANRLAHLDFLRAAGVPAYLVLVNFVGDSDMGGPPTAEAWVSTYQVVHHVMGIPRRHALSRYVVHIYPDVRPKVAHEPERGRAVPV